MKFATKVKRRFAQLLQRRFPRAAAFWEFPVSPPPRYGWGRPQHPRFYKACDDRRIHIERLLRRFLELEDKIVAIPRYSQNDGLNPIWDNEFFPPLDSIALYCMLSIHRPASYVEIGAGHSTRFARRAINDNRLSTTITCIDPAPGVPIEAIADRVIKSRLEDADLRLFEELNAGDVLFIDSSHRAFMNSDVTIVFLDILPALKPGVLVHFHDIQLPYDYPPDWDNRYYNEQYLLAAHLLGGNRLEILLPNAFITRDVELHKILDPIWNAPAMAGLSSYGASFWGRTA